MFRSFKVDHKTFTADGGIFTAVRRRAAINYGVFVVPCQAFTVSRTKPPAFRQNAEGDYRIFMVYRRDAEVDYETFMEDYKAAALRHRGWKRDKPGVKRPAPAR